jgi:hypothetical protein
MDGMDRSSAGDTRFGPVNWSQRYKANLERLSSGDRGQLTEVVDQLAERERVYGLSAGEIRMLNRAVRMLDDPGGDPAGVREPRRPSPVPASPGGPASLGGLRREAGVPSPGLGSGDGT